MKIRPLDQPPVFYLAALTSFCERFGFYLLSALFVLYLKAVHHLPDQTAFAIFSVFTAIVYVAPALGGYLADNVLGIRRAIILGLFVEGIGLILAAMPQKIFIYPGLALIAMGVGFFKTAPTNLMGRGYQKDDPRIDTGFTLFYMAMNVGACISIALSEALKDRYGWQVTFLTAAVAVFMGLIAYFFLRHTASADDSVPGYKNLKFITWFSILVGIVLCVGASSLLMVYSVASKAFLIVFITIVISLYFAKEIITSPADEKKRIVACLLLILLGLVFFVLYFQLYTSVILFMERCVHHNVFGITVKPAQFIAFNAAWVILLSPVLAVMYDKLSKNGKDLAVTTKFALGLLITSVCFFTLQWSTYFGDMNFKVAGSWMILALLFYSLGELLVSALGVAMVTRIAPRRMYGVMMGSWFLIACGLASLLSGSVANTAAIPQEVTDPKLILSIYNSAFFKMGLIGLIPAVIAFIVNPFMKRIAQLTK